MIRNYFLGCTLILLLQVGASSCTQTTKRIESSAASVTDTFRNEWDMMIGQWQHVTDTTLYIEHWEKVNDTLLKGLGTQLYKSDTVQQENIDLVISNHQAFYKVQAGFQNNGARVSFTLEPGHGDTFVFSNQMHDFPKFIGYKLVNQDSMLAIIWGGVDGEVIYVPFPLKRVN